MTAVPHAYQNAILAALNLPGRPPMYAGTVSAKDKASRRAANKVARQSRRTNRSH